MPTVSEAGFLSSLFVGDEVHAESQTGSTIIDPTQLTLDNSQTMGLLAANISPSSVVEEKHAKKEESIAPWAEINIVSENALLPQVSLMGGDPAGTGGEIAFDDVSVYVVRSGDTVSGIADLFGVSVDTILSVNELSKNTKLKEGDILLILPFSGVEHTVAKGETLQGIATKYKVDINDILFYNEIESSSKITIGMKLLIPGGSIQNTIPKSSSSIARGNSNLPTISGYFMNPVPGARRSRGITPSHKGVDLAAPTGTPIYASASGRVKFARSGYNGGFGNLVILAHSNGTETLYAHQSRIATSVGAQVSQGEIIGYVGSTGRSTGPHLHFEVKGAKNPF